jgi:hypothetical protein
MFSGAITFAFNGDMGNKDSGDVLRTKPNHCNACFACFTRPAVWRSQRRLPATSHTSTTRPGIGEINLAPSLVRLKCKHLLKSATALPAIALIFPSAPEEKLRGLAWTGDREQGRGTWRGQMDTNATRLHRRDVTTDDTSLAPCRDGQWWLVKSRTWWRRRFF